ncbi:Fe-S cluster assembly protein SufB [Candidatus Shikimatogenerans bostrichidophilus]|uniref:Fe-S cluster assembly protein SufB n=1 Tax=Candidatus Shikimatogenerans bostrichidophilus TaxID=2943807 RepID=UPI00296651C9
MKLKKNIYKYGFYTNIKSNTLSIGLNKKIIKKISKLKNEPKWMTKWRLKSFKYWKKLKYPKWSNLNYKIINFNLISYFSEIVNKSNKLDKKLIKTFEKLGVPINNNKKKISIDYIFDSTSITTTYKKILNKYGIIFCSINEAIIKYSDLIKKYIGTVVSYKDNYYASLNSAVFSDGSFCYIPKGVKCPIDLSTYFRINNSLIGQFERTLIIVDEGGSVSYLEGCTAPIRKNNQLHGAVVELIALNNSKIKYSTVQNWYPGDNKGKGGIYNFVTKRGLCYRNSKITWIQLETGSLLTWKYPSCILKGDNSIGEFRSVSLTKNYQQIDTGTKMIHIGNKTKSIIISKSICMDNSINTYRGLVKINKKSKNSKNYTQCDSLLIGNKCSTHTLPYIISTNSSAKIEHESTISNIEEEQIFYCNQRGINNENAMSIIVNGFSMDIIKKLPLEFALEAKELLNIKLKNTVG